VQSEPTVARRTVLAAGVVAGAAGIGALAGCSAHANPGASAAGGTGAGAAGAGPASGAGTVLTKVSDVPVGGAISGSFDNKPILISQPAAGTIVVFSAICTHMGCTVAPAGKDFVCPCHGSTYDMRTGAVKAGPAPAPLPKIAAHVTDGEVVAGS
jgi:Rieske Fe-S protein